MQGGLGIFSLVGSIGGKVGPSRLVPANQHKDQTWRGWPKAIFHSEVRAKAAGCRRAMLGLTIKVCGEWTRLQLRSS